MKSRNAYADVGVFSLRTIKSKSLMIIMSLLSEKQTLFYSSRPYGKYSSPLKQELAIAADPYRIPKSHPNWAGDSLGRVAVVIQHARDTPPMIPISAGEGFTLVEWGPIDVAGCYFPPRLDRREYEDALESLGEHIRRRSPWPILVGGDFNAHALEWGSPSTDPRGDSTLLWAARYGLVLLNRGRASTFVGARGESIVDLTWATPAAAIKIRGWHVDADSLGEMTDHRLIRMELVSTPRGGVTKTPPSSDKLAADGGALTQRWKWPLGRSVNALRAAIRRAKADAWRKLVSSLDKDSWGRPYKIVTKQFRPWAPPITETLGAQFLEDVVAALFPTREREGIFPRSWNMTRLVLLRKEGKPAKSPSAYRPICLLDNAGKLLERVIAARIVRHLPRDGPDLSGWGFVEHFDELAPRLGRRADALAFSSFCERVMSHKEEVERRRERAPGGRGLPLQPPGGGGDEGGGVARGVGGQRGRRLQPDRSRPGSQLAHARRRDRPTGRKRRRPPLPILEET
ncbi:RTXE polymerase, partial [Pseudoatta argentina]